MLKIAVFGLVNIEPAMVCYFAAHKSVGTFILLHRDLILLRTVTDKLNFLILFDQRDAYYIEN